MRYSFTWIARILRPLLIYSMASTLVKAVSTIFQHPRLKKRRFKCRRWLRVLVHYSRLTLEFRPDYATSALRHSRRFLSIADRLTPEWVSSKRVLASDFVESRESHPLFEVFEYHFTDSILTGSRTRERSSLLKLYNNIVLQLW